jgi:hypothetical protein
MIVSMRLSSLLLGVLLLAAAASNSAFVPRSTCSTISSRRFYNPLFMSAVADKPATEFAEKTVVRYVDDSMDVQFLIQDFTL